MKKVILLLIIMSIFSVFFPPVLQADSRGVKIVKIKDNSGNEIGLYKESYALVIGASNYTVGWPKLPGVKKDIVEIKSVLEKNGFHVITIEDPDREKLLRAFDSFITKYGLKPENRLLFYFAGHGHTIKQSYGEEMGYIIPVDAPNPNKDKDGFLTKAIDMQQIEVYAKRIQSKHALFLFDSCFSGSIFALSRAVPENISYKTAKPVRQFITSGSSDEQVPDKSIFRDQFIAALDGEADMNKDGYITGTEIGEFLQDRVANYSKGSQHPQYGKIRNPNLDKGDFVFQLAKTGLTEPISKFPDVELKDAPKSSFSMDDLETKGKQVAANKLAWNAKLNEMKRAHNQVLAYEQKDSTAELKASAWERFVSSFREDNPYSNEDDDMLIEAQARLSYWQAENQKAKHTKDQKIAMAPKPTKTSFSAEIKDAVKDIEMVFVKGGCYQMGDISGDGSSNEKPVHEVCVDDFYIGKYEVTQGLWRAVMGNNLSIFTECGDNCPVDNVSWNEAQKFISKLNSKTGKNYRLPTEAEWEYAARSRGKSEKYSGGNDIDSVAWYSLNSMRKKQQVGQKAANGLGIYDMTGNVLEWVFDLYSIDYYAASPKNNPKGTYNGTNRVLRGGSWLDDLKDSRTTSRKGRSPIGQEVNYGFRLAKT